MDLGGFDWKHKDMQRMGWEGANGNTTATYLKARQ